MPFSFQIFDRVVGRGTVQRKPFAELYEVEPHLASKSLSVSEIAVREHLVEYVLHVFQ